MHQIDQISHMFKALQFAKSETNAKSLLHRHDQIQVRKRVPTRDSLSTGFTADRKRLVIEHVTKDWLQLQQNVLGFQGLYPLS